MIESVGSLQQAVKEFYTFCIQWKLYVTDDKTNKI